MLVVNLDHKTIYIDITIQKTFRTLSFVALNIE